MENTENNISKRFEYIMDLTIKDKEQKEILQEFLPELTDEEKKLLSDIHSLRHPDRNKDISHEDYYEQCQEIDTKRALLTKDLMEHYKAIPVGETPFKDYSKEEIQEALKDFNQIRERIAKEIAQDRATLVEINNNIKRSEESIELIKSGLADLDEQKASHEVSNKEFKARREDLLKQLHNELDNLKTERNTQEETLEEIELSTSIASLAKSTEKQLKSQEFLKTVEPALQRTSDSIKHLKQESHDFAHSVEMAAKRFLNTKKYNMNLSDLTFTPIKNFIEKMHIKSALHSFEKAERSKREAEEITEKIQKKYNKQAKKEFDLQCKGELLVAIAHGVKYEKPVFENRVLSDEEILQFASSSQRKALEKAREHSREDFMEMGEHVQDMLKDRAKRTEKVHNLSQDMAQDYINGELKIESLSDSFENDLNKGLYQHDQQLIDNLMKIQDAVNRNELQLSKGDLAQLNVILDEAKKQGFDVGRGDEKSQDERER